MREKRRSCKNLHYVFCTRCYTWSRRTSKQTTLFTTAIVENRGRNFFEETLYETLFCGRNWKKFHSTSGDGLINYECESTENFVTSTSEFWFIYFIKSCSMLQKVLPYKFPCFKFVLKPRENFQYEKDPTVLASNYF